MVDGRAYDDYHVGIEEAINSDPKTFFLLCGGFEEEAC
jgi:hypothetical protein